VRIAETVPSPPAKKRHDSSVRSAWHAGGDVHGFGDAHEREVIGWATGGSPDDIRWMYSNSCSSVALAIISSRLLPSETWI